MNMTRIAIPLNSLLTRGSFRFDFASVFEDSLSRLKKGFVVVIMPMAAMIANAGAKMTRQPNH